MNEWTNELFTHDGLTSAFFQSSVINDGHVKLVPVVFKAPRSLSYDNLSLLKLHSRRKTNNKKDLGKPAEKWQSVSRLLLTL